MQAEQTSGGALVGFSNSSTAFEPSEVFAVGGGNIGFHGVTVNIAGRKKTYSKYIVGELE